MTDAKDGPVAAIAKFADLPGVRQRYVDTGGPGEALILLHANTGTIESWEPQLGPLSRAGFRVIAFDRRGWGGSAVNPDTGPQPAPIADDIDALADHLGLDRFCLLGVAGGAFAVIDYAAWKPERLRKMLVCASTGYLRDGEVPAMSAEMLVPGFREMPIHFREVGAAYRGRQIEGLKRWIEIEHGSGHGKMPLPPFRTPNTMAKVATISVPTLAIAGGADLIAPPTLMKLWTSALKDCRHAVIAESGHSISWEYPDEFNRLVIGFLKE